MRNVFGDQGNMERNFWEQGNSVKVNFGEHLNLFLRNKGTTVNFHREQGNMHPPGRPSLLKMGPAVLSFKSAKGRYKLDRYLRVPTICILLNSVATSGVLAISLLSSFADIFFLQFIQTPVICRMPLLSSSILHNE